MNDVFALALVRWAIAAATGAVAFAAAFVAHAEPVHISCFNVPAVNTTMMELVILVVDVDKGIVQKIDKFTEENDKRFKELPIVIGEDFLRWTDNYTRRNGKLSYEYSLNRDTLELYVDAFFDGPGGRKELVSEHHYLRCRNMKKAV